MFLRVVLAVAVMAEFSFCNKASKDAQRAADEKRIAELQGLEARAAQREADEQAQRLARDRERLSEDQAALDREKTQLAKDRFTQTTEADRARHEAEERRVAERENSLRAEQERNAREEQEYQARRPLPGPPADNSYILTNDERRDSGEQQLDSFYDALDPMGDWVQTETMATSGSRARRAPATGGRTRTARGFIPTTAGRGNRTRISAGRRITTAGGRVCAGGAGVGAGLRVGAGLGLLAQEQGLRGVGSVAAEAYSKGGFNSAVDSYYDIGPATYNFVPSRSIGEPSYRGLVVDAGAQLHFHRPHLECDPDGLHG